MAFVAQLATVEVKPAWYSKVNWVAGATALAGVLTQLVPFVPPKYQPLLTCSVIVIGGAATIYTKTYHNTTITPSSAAKV